MRLSVNGKAVSVDEGLTVKGLLNSQGITEPRGVAVAVDGDVVPRDAWANTFLKEDQRVEILRAVQGG